jgi:hypothetical protein
VGSAKELIGTTTFANALYSMISKCDGGTLGVDQNIRSVPAHTPHTQWIFLETIDTLKFPEPWDIDDFQEVLDRLRRTGITISKGEIIQPPRQRGGVDRP